MGSTLSHLIYHLIFSTKDRFPSLSGEHTSQIYDYIAGIIRGKHALCLAIGGARDHVHIVCVLRPGDCLADIVREIKASSSKWINREGMFHARFAWQSGYGAFTVSKSQVDAVVEYVGGQEEHHRTVTFQEEYRAFLQKHGVAFDERYVWD